MSNITLWEVFMVLLAVGVILRIIDAIADVMYGTFLFLLRKRSPFWGDAFDRWMDR